MLGGVDSSARRWLGDTGTEVGLPITGLQGDTTSECHAAELDGNNIRVTDA